MLYAVNAVSVEMTKYSAQVKRVGLLCVTFLHTITREEALVAFKKSTLTHSLSLLVSVRRPSITWASVVPDNNGNSSTTPKLGKKAAIKLHWRPAKQLANHLLELLKNKMRFASFSFSLD